MDRIDCLVIGAGVVGLACARALALAGREVLVIERAPQIGTGISARNSEVIHAGLHYPPASLQGTRFCRAERAGEVWRVRTRSGDGIEFEIEARCLVNAAGLDASTWRRRCRACPLRRLPRSGGRRAITSARPAGRRSST